MRILTIDEEMNEIVMVKVDEMCLSFGGNRVVAQKMLGIFGRGRKNKICLGLAGAEFKN